MKVGVTIHNPLLAKLMPRIWCHVWFYNYGISKKSTLWKERFISISKVERKLKIHAQAPEMKHSEI